MSTRGGYGFIVDNQETIIYTGSGANLDSLGQEVLRFLKDSDVSNLRKRVLSLSEVESKEAVTEQDIDRIQANTGVSAYTRHQGNIDNWYHLLYPGQNNPEHILEAGVYIDGSWIIGSIDLEFFYLIDFDRNTLEVYHGYRRENPDNGRFSGRKVESGGRLPTLLATYPLETLPNSLYELEEKLYE